MKKVLMNMKEVLMSNGKSNIITQFANDNNIPMVDIDIKNSSIDKIIKLVIITATCAKREYIGKEYIENIMITKETYEKIKDEDLNFYIYNLNGKHSEIKANITIQEYSENEIKSIDMSNINCNFDKLFDKLFDIFVKYNLSLAHEMHKVSEYIRSLDPFITVNVRIKESQQEALSEFIRKLNS